MKMAFKPLIENLACELCQESLDQKLRDAVVQWASVKVNDHVYILYLSISNSILSVLSR